MEYLIITNNSLVAEKYQNVIFVKGVMEDVLVKTRNLVHEGYELLTHPLAASLKMLSSPYRSIVLGRQGEKFNEMHVKMIENSMATFLKHLEQRGVDLKNGDDYQKVDSWLLDCAVEEL